MNRRALTDSTIKPYCTHILTHLHTYLRTKLCLARLVASSKEFVVAVMNPFGDDVSAQWAPPSDRPLPRPCHRARASPSVAQPTVRFASLRFRSLVRSFVLFRPALLFLRSFSLSPHLENSSTSRVAIHSETDTKTMTTTATTRRGGAPPPGTMAPSTSCSFSTATLPCSSGTCRAADRRRRRRRRPMTTTTTSRRRDISPEGRLATATKTTTTTTAEG